jgi:hypothetical protein
MGRYDSIDDSIIRNHIVENPDNLSQAFERAGLELGRTPEAIRSRWYKKLSNEGVTLTVFTESKHCINKKSDTHNIGYSKGNTPSRRNRLTKWQRILRILFE